MADHPTPWDVVVRGGRIVDGSGAPWVRGDLAIAGDRVGAIAPRGMLAPGGEEVDAEDLVVCPGFIDLMSHSLWPLMRDGRSLSKLVQGVTTEIMGEGFTPAPAGGAVGPATPPAGADPAWAERIAGWSRFGDWLEAMEEAGTSPNVGSFLGGGTLRGHVCGMRMGAASPGELAEMRRVMDEAMRDGAMGVAYALIYPPDAFATTEEIVEVCRVVAEYGGVYACHLRSETSGLLDAIDEAVEIGRRSGVAVEIYHLKAAGKENWHLAAAAVDRIASARAAGVDVTADLYPYGASATGLSALLPVSLAADGRLFERLADGEEQERVRAQLAAGTVEVDVTCPPEDAYPVGLAHPEHDLYAGASLADIASCRGEDWLDTVFGLLLAEGRDVLTVYHDISEDNVRMQISAPWITVASDGAGLDPAWARAAGPRHPRDYGTFARVLERYVRDEGLLSLEEAIRRMTSAVAHRLRLGERGHLTPGAFADVVILDPDAVREHATFADPHRLASGVRDVWVNGTAVVRAGAHTGARPGRVVRGPGARSPREAPLWI